MILLDMAKKKKLTAEDLESAYNPFTANLDIPIYTKYFKGQYYRDEDNNIKTVMREVEKVPSVKVYLLPKNRVHIATLSPRAKELLFWLLFRIEHNKDYIWINKELYMKEAGIRSINTYKPAVEELVFEGMIQYAGVRDYYWINPQFFFNGNRIMKYPDNVIGG